MKLGLKKQLLRLLNTLKELDYLIRINEAGVKKAIATLTKYIKGVGFRAARLFFRSLFTKKDVIKINLSKIKFPILVRTNISDFLIFEQVFFSEEFNLPISLKPKLIIDGGAYVGYVSIFFANKFPNAEIIAIEPDESNFKMLKRNTSYYPNIKLIKAGLWHKNAYIKIKDLDTVKCMFQIEDSTREEGLKSVTIDEILKNSHHQNIDILKLDVEGSEKEVFSDNYEWLSKVNVLIVELHDRYRPGCSKVFYSAIKKHDFKEFRSGENVVLINKHLLC